MAHKTIIEEELPQRLSMRKSQYSGPWYYRYKGAERVNGQSIYKILDRVLENNIGKSFDLAFSYYCKLVPVQYQRLFLDNFIKKYRGVPDYFVDENGNIQENKDNSYRSFGEYKGPYKFETVPTTYEWHKKFEYLTYQELLSIINPKMPRDMKPTVYTHRNNIPYGRVNQYERICIEGEVVEFESQRDPKLRQLKAERRSKKKKADRERKKLEAQKSYSFLTKTEQEIINARKTDLISRDRHGFDDMSFKNRKEDGSR